MASLKALEQRIAADRAALALNTRRVRQAVRAKVASPAVLAGGFAVGFAGGWFSVAHSQRRRERERLCPERPPRETVVVKPEPTLWSRLRTLIVLTLPLWQRYLGPAASSEESDS